MLKLYARLAGQAARLTGRGWPVAVALLLYAPGLELVTAALQPLGFIGGILAGFAVAFVVSSYLHLVSIAVTGRKIRGADIRDSFGARFWDVVSVLFALWIIDWLIGSLTTNLGPRGPIVLVLVGLTMAVFFNPVPELIYQSRERSFALLLAAGRFVSAHWPEWLAPNALFAAVVLAPLGLLAGGPIAERLIAAQALFSLDGLVRAVLLVPLWMRPLMLLFITWVMLFRGLLFAELASGISRRARDWRDLGARRP